MAGLLPHFKFTSVNSKSSSVLWRLSKQIRSCVAALGSCSEVHLFSVSSTRVASIGEWHDLQTEGALIHRGGSTSVKMQTKAQP